MSLFISPQSLQYERVNSGIYSGGIWTKLSSSVVSFEGAIQPGPGRNMQMLPELWRDREVLRLYTNTQLYTINDTNPDRVLWQGGRYMIISKEDFSHSALITAHIKYYMVKEEDDESNS